jgi:N-acetyl-gamma-glutamyl-phosphate reductase common form
LIKVALLGGRGYVGQELLNLLTRCPIFRIMFIGSNTAAGEPVAKHFDLENASELRFSNIDPVAIQQTDADVWILAQPNGHSADLVRLIEATHPSAKILDISADMRFDPGWVYGLPERNQRLLQEADRVSNPGCYATAAQLALLPIAEQLEEAPSLFGISGHSGAGRTPSDRNDLHRLADNILPYSLVGHSHEREISYQIGRDVRFTPHVAPFFRGLSVTIHGTLKQPTDVTALFERYQQFYAEFPFVSISVDIPEIQQVANTNICQIGGFSIDLRDRRRFVVISVLDNLRKGAASQAIQNLHLMFARPDMDWVDEQE